MQAANGTAPVPTTAVAPWRFDGVPEVETTSLRPGVDLIASRFRGEPVEFRHVERDDVFAVAFHVAGGARFDMEGRRFVTRPLDVWAGGAPRGGASRFRLPSEGFRTVSVRFAPEAALELFDGPGAGAATLSSLARHARVDAAVAHLGSLRADELALVLGTLDSPYAGRARDLHRESCVLALLAGRLGDADAAAAGSGARRRAADLRRMEAARRLLEERLADPPSIAELARAVGTNDFALKRGFKQRFGTTVFGYVRRRRMERAFRELRDGASVQAAAATVGYACPRCFASAFRRAYGVLPSDAGASATADETPAHVTSRSR